LQTVENTRIAQRHPPVFQSPGLRQIKKTEPGHEAAAQDAQERNDVQDENDEGDERRRRVTPHTEIDDLRFELPCDRGELPARD